MSDTKPKLVWVVMVPGELWGHGFIKRKTAVDLRRNLRARANNPRSKSARHKKTYKYLRVVRVTMKYVEVVR